MAYRDDPAELEIDDVDDSFADDGAMGLDDDTSLGDDDDLASILSDVEDSEDSADSQDSDEDDEGAPAGKKKELEANKGLKGRMLEYQKRGEKQGYQRGLTEAQKAWEAEKAELLSKLAETEEKSLAAEAKELAKSENISEALALRILKAEKGTGAKATAKKADEGDDDDKGTEEKARDSKTGKFVSKEQAEANARAKELMTQRNAILKATGIDALKLFNENPKVKRLVSEGKWDFADVAKQYQKEMAARGRQPMVSRTPNQGDGGRRTVRDLNDKEFDRLDAQLATGKKVRFGR